MVLFPPLSSPSSTRVLVLQRGSGSDILSLSHKVIDIEHKLRPSYEAVSYAWGSPDGQQIISLAGENHRIHRNLYDCLHRLRKPYKSRTLWIDALSISQTDLVEKGQQVSIIDQIFAAAERVLAWIGEHDAVSEVVFQEIRRCTQSEGLTKRRWFKKDKDESKDPSTSQSRGFMKRLFAKKKDTSDVEDDPTPTKEEINQFVAIRDAYETFLQRAYFTRVWIIQEIILAKYLVLHCGQDTATWEDFQRTFFEVIGNRPPIQDLDAGSSELWGDDSDADDTSDSSKNGGITKLARSESLPTSSATQETVRGRAEYHNHGEDADRQFRHEGGDEKSIEESNPYPAGRDTICSKLVAHRIDFLFPERVNAKRPPGYLIDHSELTTSLVRIISSYRDANCYDKRDRVYAMQSLDRRQFWQDKIPPDYTAHISTVILHLFIQKMMDSDCGLAANRVAAYMIPDPDSGDDDEGDSAGEVEAADDGENGNDSDEDDNEDDDDEDDDEGDDSGSDSDSDRDSDDVERRFWLHQGEVWERCDPTKGMPHFTFWLIGGILMYDLIKSFRLTVSELVSLLRAIRTQLELTQAPTSEWDFHEMCLWRYAAYTFAFATVRYGTKTQLLDCKDCCICSEENGKWPKERLVGLVHFYGQEPDIPGHEDTVEMLEDVITHLASTNHLTLGSGLDGGSPEPCQVPPLPSWWGDSETAKERRREIFRKNKVAMYSRRMRLKNFAFELMRETVPHPKALKLAKKVIYMGYSEDL